MNKSLLIIGITLLILDATGGVAFHFIFRNSQLFFILDNIDLIILSRAFLFLMKAIIVALYFTKNKLHFPFILVIFSSLMFLLNLWGFSQYLTGKVTNNFYLFTYFSAATFGLLYGISISLVKGKRYRYLRLYGITILVLQTLLVISYFLASNKLFRTDMVDFYGYLTYISNMSPLLMAIQFIQELRYKPEIDEISQDILDDHE